MTDVMENMDESQNKMLHEKAKQTEKKHILHNCIYIKLLEIMYTYKKQIRCCL